MQPRGLGVQGHPHGVTNTGLEWIAYNPIPQQRKKKEDPEKEKGFQEGVCVRIETSKMILAEM